MIIKTRIDNFKMKQFQEIMIASGGRYIIDPFQEGNIWRVEFDPGNYRLFNASWESATVDIIEIRKDQLWRRIFRRYCLGWIERRIR